MQIRPLSAADWSTFHPVFREVVADAARGQGVGRALGEWVLRWAREQGYAAMQFNAVVETNTAAVRLWRDLGFEVVGTVPEAFASATHGRVGLHVMHRYL